MDVKFLNDKNEFIADSIQHTGIPQKYGIRTAYEIVQTSFPPLFEAKL